MKYNLRAFDSAVKYYEGKLKAFAGKNIFVAFDSMNEHAYFSLAPLSRAAHNLGCDMAANLYSQKSEPIAALMEVWHTKKELDMGIKNERTKALAGFISIVDKKAKGDFEKMFIEPELMIDADQHGFITTSGEHFDFRPGWFKKHKWKELLETGKIIWKQTYDIKPNEKVGCGFDLISKDSDMRSPLEDYFDSYAIARTMFLSCPVRQKTMRAVSGKKNMVVPGERTTELSTTLMGCELEKEINEPVFKAYKKLSMLLNLQRFKVNQASFYIKGDGYGGKHIFGDVIGYPTPNRKSRWDGPSGLIYQLPWYPQTKIDGRGPLCRMGFTDTIPIDRFVEACRIDWLAMKRKDDKLIALAKKSDKIMVESKKTNLEIGLVKPSGERRELMNSDVDIRTILDKAYLKKGIKAGNMGNIPAGEMFTTPEYVNGIFYGDVVINIDKSYRLYEKKPLVIRCLGDHYKIEKGPKEIIKKFNDKRHEGLKLLETQAKSGSVPISLLQLKKKNFNRVGEFAINTNPKAKLCNYLIVNEKIAGMIHLALGSGFEADRASVYHYDTVINAKKQKLDIYGLNSKTGQKYWMMKKGKLVV